MSSLSSINTSSVTLFLVTYFISEKAWLTKPEDILSNYTKRSKQFRCGAKVGRGETSPALKRNFKFCALISELQV